MRRDLVVIILVVAGAAAAVKLGLWVAAQQRQRVGRERSRQEWSASQCSQEIVCDACGERTTGLVLSRAEAGSFQVCPACGAKAGRPVVYYMCQNPDCNRRLVKVAASVWTEAGPSPGGSAVCPNCGSGMALTPVLLNFKSAQRIADETEQEFP
jgi:uncharacterized protein YlaI